MVQRSGVFDLKGQLVFYGAYHNHPINQSIHFVFVPIIMWTVAVWLSYSPSVPIPGVCDMASGKYLECNGALLLILVYAAYYVTLDALAGLSWIICIGIPIWWSATAFQSCVPGAWQWAIVAHVVAWWAQVHIGHGLIEKRKPALLDSFFQSLALAPLFVWFELLFALGFRKEMRRQVQEAVDEEIRHSTREPLVG